MSLLASLWVTIIFNHRPAGIFYALERERKKNDYHWQCALSLPSFIYSCSISLIWEKKFDFLGRLGRLDHLGSQASKDFFLHYSVHTKDCSGKSQNSKKRLLMVQDFCFWAFWATGPELKKKLGLLWTSFEGGFFMFSWAKEKKEEF